MVEQPGSRACPGLPGCTLPHPSWRGQWRLISAAASTRVVVVVGVVIVRVRLFPHNRAATSAEPAVADATPRPPLPRRRCRLQLRPHQQSRPRCTAVPPRARQLYLARAKTGGPGSELQGRMILYAKGEGVAQDYAGSREVVSRSHFIGVRAGRITSVGVLSEEGEGFSPSTRTRSGWCGKAAEGNFPRAKVQPSRGRLHARARDAAGLCRRGRGSAPACGAARASCRRWSISRSSTSAARA